MINVIEDYKTPKLALKKIYTIISYSQIYRLLENNPIKVLKFYFIYKNQPYYNEVLKKAVYNTAEKSPEDAIIYLDNYIKQPYAKEIILDIAKKKPKLVLRFSSYYSKQPYAKDIFLSIVKSSPEIGLSLSYFYEKQPYYNEILKQAVYSAAEKSPWVAINYRYKYKNKDYAKNVILKAKGTIKIAVDGYGIPEKEIKESDFPIDKNKFKKYLSGINHLSKKTTNRGKKPGYTMITIPMQKFENIFFSNNFQSFLKSQAGKMSYMNAFSLTQSVYRKMEKEKLKLNENNIKKITEKIHKLLQTVKNREIFGPNTKIILFTHKEEKFNNEGIIEKIYYRSGGRKENVLINAKGVEMENGKNVVKEKVLNTIKKTKGNTTIFFAGHGSAENWAFSNNHIDNLNHSLKTDPYRISYKELGNALIESGNIKNFNIVGDTCFGYDYIQNLFSYIESKGVKEKPYISISAANKEKGSWGVSGFIEYLREKTGLKWGKSINSFLTKGLFNSFNKGEPATVGDFLKAEGKIWKREDPAIFIGNPDQYNNEEKKVIKNSKSQQQKIKNAPIYTEYPDLSSDELQPVKKDKPTRKNKHKAKDFLEISKLKNKENYERLA